MLIFPNQCRPYISPWLVHFSVNIVNVLHSKDAIIKFALICSSHGGMYGLHQFGKISITLDLLVGTSQEQS